MRLCVVQTYKQGDSGKRKRGGADMHEKEKIVEIAVQIELELGENNYDFDLFHWRISHSSVQAKEKKVQPRWRSRCHNE